MSVYPRLASTTYGRACTWVVQQSDVGSLCDECATWEGSSANIDHHPGILRATPHKAAAAYPRGRLHMAGITEHCVRLMNKDNLGICSIIT
jgi:hypothetical protein